MYEIFLYIIYGFCAFVLLITALLLQAMIRISVPMGSQEGVDPDG